MKNYVAYDAANAEMEMFDAFEDAKKWLVDKNDFSEGIPEEFNEGFCWVAKITHRTSVTETDNKRNYPCKKDTVINAHCSDCENKDCDGTEEWPYDSEWDWVGDVVLNKVDGK